MKNHFSTLLFCLLLTLQVYSQEQNIRGHFLNKSFPDKIYLSENIGGKYNIIDTAHIDQSGDFTFRSIYQTGYYSLSFTPQNGVQIILNNEDVELEFRDTLLINNIRILQSEENILLWTFIPKRKSFKSQISQAYMNKTRFAKNTKQYSSYQAIENHLTENYQQYILQIANKTPTSFFARTVVADIEINTKNDFFKYINFKDSDLIRSGVITKKITDYLQFHTQYTEDGFVETIDFILSLATENKKVYEFVLNYLLEFFNATGPDIVLDYMIESYVIGEACSDLHYQDVLQNKLEAYKKLQLGMTAPNISTFNPNGILQNLKDICSTSRINLLYFGSSHCSFCNDITPDLLDLLRSQSTEDLQCIYFSLDTDYLEWKNSQKNVPSNWLSLSELKGWESKSAQIFQVHKTPTFYILDQESRIISKPKSMPELKIELDLMTQKKAR